VTEFLHGVETIAIRKGPRKIQEVRTAVIGLIGTAPIHHVDDAPEVGKASLVLSDRDAPQFGDADLAGYTLPAAIKAIHDQGAGTIFVVNVFDPTLAAHRTVVASATETITDGVVTLTHQDLISVTVTTSADAACVEGTDYTVDLVTGIITVIEGGNLDGDADCKVAYVRANPAGVVADDVIGEVLESGQRVGAQALLDCSSRFGFGAKLLIAPGFSSDATVAAALQVLAQKTKLRAIAFADAPVGSTRDEVLEGRAPDGEINLTLADPRLVYCYPYLKITETDLEPFSQRLVGVIANTDREVGYWRSPSNRPILGIVGIEVPLSAGINNPSSDVNALNGAGVCTVFTGYGVAPRVWGNRSSVFPGTTGIDTFIACQRTIDVVEESVELATLTHMDGPITSVLIEAVLSDVNEFMRTLVGRGALMPGSKCEYFAEDNPSSELADGHITFTYTFCPPPPAERITYKAVVDTTLLAAAGG
jgi:phage tail sheath protein FI